MANRATAFAEWQFIDLYEPHYSTESLLARLREYCLPGGEDRARQIRAVRITEKGEMRTSPQAPWMRFTAEETIGQGICAPVIHGETVSAEKIFSDELKIIRHAS